MEDFSFLDDHYDLYGAYNFIAYGAADKGAFERFWEGWEAENGFEPSVGSISNHEQNVLNNIMLRAAASGRLRVRGKKKYSSKVEQIPADIFRSFQFEPIAATDPDPAARKALGLEPLELTIDNDEGAFTEIIFFKSEIENLRSELVRRLSGDKAAGQMVTDNSNNSEISDSDELYKSGLPGKPNTKHHYMRELERIYDAGELKETIKEQADILHKWVKKEHPKYAPSSTGAVENAIRDRYNVMKRASKEIS
ncbi:hypothetical protein NBZ79_00645 [Sneathiella marina]|uniref:Uncharacterized protein n=1 Tax=Sneathiella marina TaxID=2950108 RepID=A0ABY4W2S7_9PROT|nr:hypothetical protein [Sneathiella marina]USG61483.1 hypothetical protein NBZ79_00645 [Sneathiella marina]